MLEFLAMLVAGLYVVTSVVGLKAIAFGPFVIASGVLLIAIVKPVLDIINEVHGPAAARAVVVRMTIVRAFVFALLALVAGIPAVSEPPGFRAILAGSVWLFFAGAIAELVASVAIDIPIFTWLKEHTSSGFLARQYASNVSLVIQTVVFTSFYMLIVPGVAWARVFAGQTVALVVISSALAPIASLVVRRIKG